MSFSLNIDVRGRGSLSNVCLRIPVLPDSAIDVELSPAVGLAIASLEITKTSEFLSAKPCKGINCSDGRYTVCRKSATFNSLPFESGSLEIGELTEFALIVDAEAGLQ